MPNLLWLPAATCRTPPVAVLHSSNEDFEAVELLPRFQEMRKAEHTCHRYMFQNTAGQAKPHKNISWMSWLNSLGKRMICIDLLDAVGVNYNLLTKLENESSIVRPVFNGKHKVGDRQFIQTPGKRIKRFCLQNEIVQHEAVDTSFWYICLQKILLVLEKFRDAVKDRVVNEILHKMQLKGFPCSLRQAGPLHSLGYRWVAWPTT